LFSVNPSQRTTHTAKAERSFFFLIGLSNAMLLPAVTAFSLAGAPRRYALASVAMGFASATDSEADAGTNLLLGLRYLCKQLKVRLCLLPILYCIMRVKG